MKRISMPPHKEDSENSCCPGNKSLHWNFVDTNAVHVKLHPVLKKHGFFFDGGNFPWDIGMMNIKRATKRHCLTTVHDQIFCPCAAYPSWSNWRCLDFMWQALRCTCEMAADFPTEIPNHPKFQTGTAVAVNRCNTPMSSGSPEAADFPTEDSLSAWELGKIW